jgi:hypothetical protein
MLQILAWEADGRKIAATVLRGRIVFVDARGESGVGNELAPVGIEKREVEAMDFPPETFRRTVTNLCRQGYGHWSGQPDDDGVFKALFFAARAAS